MINNKFEKSVIDKIKNLKPKSKWQFLFKNYMIWIIGFLSLLVGGVAVSVMMYLILHDDLTVYKQFDGGLFEFLLFTLPYFWLVLLAIFIFVVYQNIKRTKKGYKYSLPVVIFTSIGVSILIGAFFFKAGLGALIDEALGQKAPFYSKIFNRQVEFWSQVDEGRLAGVISFKVDEKNFLLVDMNMKEWQVYYDPALQAGLSKKMMTHSECFKANGISVGMPVHIIGSKISEQSFRAERVMPAHSGRGFFMKGMHQRMHRSGDGSDLNMMNMGMMKDLD